jgi:rhodanese-related sulfurtransferase
VSATSVEQLLADARRHIDRVRPEELGPWRVAGALLIDIRPERQRAEEGEFDHAIVVERNVLEWRFDLGGDHALAVVDGYGQPLVVACSEGYASSLAAASLRDLGFTRVADLDGGYLAWRAWQENAGAHT